MNFKQYIKEASDTKLEVIYSQLKAICIVPSKDDYDNFKSEIMDVLPINKYDENQHQAAIIAGYAEPKITKQDLRKLLSMVKNEISEDIYRGKTLVNLGRLQIILEILISNM